MSERWRGGRDLLLPVALHLGRRRGPWSLDAALGAASTTPDAWSPLSYGCRLSEHVRQPAKDHLAHDAAVRAYEPTHRFPLCPAVAGQGQGLAITVVVTLALGIGANAAIFSVVRGVYCGRSSTATRTG